MRIRRWIAGLSALALLWAGGCSKDDAGSGDSSGVLRLGVKMGAVSRAAGEEAQRCRIELHDAEGTLLRSYTGVENLPAEIRLVSGDYYVEVSAGDNTAAAFASPNWYGREEFAISPAAASEVEVVCKRTTCSVEVSFSKRVELTFGDFSAVASSVLGQLVFDLERSGDEGCFVVAEDNTLQWTFKGTRLSNGSSYEKSGEFAAGAVANKLYRLAFDCDMPGGELTVDIAVDEQTNDREENIDVYQRPVIRGSGFDMEQLQEFADQDYVIEINTSSALTELTLAQSLLGEEPIDLLSEAGAAALKDKGIEVASADARHHTLTLRAAALDWLAYDGEANSFVISAADAEGKGRSASLGVTVTPSLHTLSISDLIARYDARDRQVAIDASGTYPFVAGTVLERDGNVLMVSDGTEAHSGMRFVLADLPDDIAPGQQVLLRVNGRTYANDDDARTVEGAAEVTVTGAAGVPAPVPIEASAAAFKDYQSMLVTVGKTQPVLAVTTAGDAWNSSPLFEAGYTTNTDSYYRVISSDASAVPAGSGNLSGVVRWNGTPDPTAETPQRLPQVNLSSADLSGSYSKEGYLLGRFGTSGTSTGNVADFSEITGSSVGVDFRAEDHTGGAISSPPLTVTPSCDMAADQSASWLNYVKWKSDANAPGGLWFNNWLYGVGFEIRTGEGLGSGSGTATATGKGYIHFNVPHTESIWGTTLRFSMTTFVWYHGTQSLRRCVPKDWAVEVRYEGDAGYTSLGTFSFDDPKMWEYLASSDEELYKDFIKDIEFEMTVPAGNAGQAVEIRISPASEYNCRNSNEVEWKRWTNNTGGSDNDQSEHWFWAEGTSFTGGWTAKESSINNQAGITMKDPAVTVHRVTIEGI